MARNQCIFVAHENGGFAYNRGEGWKHSEKDVTFCWICSVTCGNYQSTVLCFCLFQVFYFVDCVLGTRWPPYKWNTSTCGFMFCIMRNHRIPMEIPHMVRVEEHQPWRILHNLASSTQESTIELASTSANGSLDHKEDDPITEDQSLMVEPNEDLPNLNKNCACDNYSPVKSMENEGQEPKQDLGSSQFVENLPSKSTASSNDCSSKYSPSASAVDIKSNQETQNPPALTLNLSSECIKTEFKKLEPVSNGPVFTLGSTFTFVVPANFIQGVLDLPHVVRQRPSTITFSENTCFSSTSSPVFVYESSDGGESSQDGEKENDDDDVFLDSPYSKDLFLSARQKSSDKSKQKRKYCVGAPGEVDQTFSSSGYEAEAETSSKEVCIYWFSILFFICIFLCSKNVEVYRLYVTITLLKCRFRRNSCFFL